MNNEWKDGMPPVGVECEYSFNMFDDESMTLPATFIGMDGRVAVIKIYNPERKYTSTTLNCLRPIKIKGSSLNAQNIGGMAKIIDACDTDEPLDMANELYQEGCRITRELTPEIINKIGMQVGSNNDHTFAKAIAAYVRGEYE